MCGATDLEEGFLLDAGQGSRGYQRWVEGPLRQGIFGGAKTFGKRRRQIAAHRCPHCFHLELFAGEEDY